MKTLYYFQRYSQRENWATNNTLLLLSRLYQFNRIKFQNAIKEILGQGIELNIGIQFSQQSKNKDSVPDGIIEQSSFKIVIETKLADNFTADQLIRHLSSFKDKNETQILLAITKHDTPTSIIEEVNAYLKSKSSNIKFASTSFIGIANAVRQSLQDYDVEMLEIVEEFVSFCEENGLINQKNSTLLALTTGMSIDMNLKYNVYYDPATRNHNLPFKYIGLYNDKNIQAVGEVKKIVECDLVKGKLEIKNDVSINADERKRIQGVIEETNYYDLTKDNKFFLIEEFHPTSFKKISHSSMRAKKYFFLHDIDGYRKDMDAAQIAMLLNGKTWE
jgi:hypothetical protein